MLRDMLQKKHYTTITKNTTQPVHTSAPTTTQSASGSRQTNSASEHHADNTATIPEGLWKKCNKCGKPIYVEDVKNNYYICPKCGGYFRIHAYRRIKMIADKGSFEEWNKEMELSNPLNFPGYEKKLAAASEKSGLNEALVIGKATINGSPAVIGSCDARFLMSSMGHNVGEKICLAVERATAEKLPVILFACSGGARMQEGMVSLMQMAKTSAALKKHHEAGQLFISVLTDPTTGGVTASFAMLGDIILAEPGALIGFAGPRVIRQTIGQKLPEGFQRAEFLLEHGFIDRIVKREELKETLYKILTLHTTENNVGNGIAPADVPVDTDTLYSQTTNSVSQTTTVSANHQKSTSANHQKITSVKKGTRAPWDTVQLSRKADRPVASDYIEALFDDFMEFHGDRCYGDDGAIIGGIGSFHGMPVTIIAQEKGKTTKENIHRNFGMPSPEGYRKALRLMRQAEAFHRPVICFVDTPGAFCGIEAEERGQGEAIARNLFELSDLKVPVLSIVIGEGGSGGALALAVANEVWMLENAIYSILSPEGFASILWKDSKRANEAAEVMKITAPELLELGIIDRIIPERKPASPETLPKLTVLLDNALSDFLTRYSVLEGDVLTAQRYDRFRKF